MALEGLWTGQIQDASGIWVNGGVVVFDAGRMYGGDGSYYYIGTYTARENQFVGDVRVGNYSGIHYTVWGDETADFRITVDGKIVGNQITGLLVRQDKPSACLRFLAVRKEALP